MATPKTIGPYHILERLGVGGMGEVFLAEQREPIRRKVALKWIRTGMDQAELIARFESERQALALMDHPGIARVLDAGATDDDRPYFVMEYVKGESITKYCDRARLTVVERAELMVLVCDAVQHAHQRAIIHRDLKPSNVMVVSEGGVAQPKVIDFGIAKALVQPLTDLTLMTEFGQVIGTPEYMSPEQSDTSVDRVDTRTDVYSLGVIFYQLLVGTLPFANDDAKPSGVLEVLRRVREEEPSRPSTRVSSLGEQSTSAAKCRSTTRQQMSSQLRGDLDWIVMRALEKEPARRYGSASDLAREIERFLRNEPVLAGPPSASYRLRKFVRRHRVGVAFAAVTVMLLLTLAISVSVQNNRIGEERDKATDAAFSAIREAETSRQVTEFMASVFEGADPDVTGGVELTARELLDRGAARIASLDAQPVVQAELRKLMARVYVILGEFDTALPMINASVAFYRGDGKEHPRGLPEALHLQASVLDNGRNQPVLAEASAREAVKLWRERDEPMMEAESLNALATTLWHQQRIDEAAACYRQAIAICKRLHGEDTTTVTAALTNLGSMFLVTEDYEQAEQIYLRVIAMEEADGNAHRNHSLGTSLHLLAVALDGLDRKPEAITVEQRSLAIRELVWGPEHWHVALSMTTLGNLYRETGRVADSEQLLKRAAKIAAATWDEHPELWFAQRSLARTRVALKDFAAVESAMTVQREVMQKPGREYWLLEVIEILGASAEGKHDMPTAESRYRAATELAATLFDPDDSERQRVAHAFAAVLRKNGKSSEAAVVEAATK